MYYFRWFINFIFVANPYFFFSIFMIIVNLIMNVLFNNWWAGGNFLLIFNTVYLVLQTVMSWPLVYEIPFYLQHFRFFRFFSVIAAFIYVWVYGFVMMDWLYQLYFEPTSTYQEYQLFDILVNMFLAYNVVFHLHILPVNCAIFMKEFFLLIFPPMLKQNKGYNLDLQDAEDAVSPSTYTNMARGQLPDQESHKNEYRSPIKKRGRN